MDTQTILTLVSVLGMGLANLLVVTWKASAANTQLIALEARLARIEGHEEERSNQRGALLERIARLEARAGLPHPLQASL